MSDLELGVIGNCAVVALIDRDACVVQYCLPRFDEDPVFHPLLGARRDAPDARVFAFVESFDSEHLDVGVLLMTDVGFLDASDPRMVSTMEQSEAVLARGPHMMRYEAGDDFGVPGTAFNTCSFWRIEALARTGRVDKAREHFEALLALRSRLGLMSEDVDLQTGELWGNYPQTYSLVGIINCAVRLSRSWEKAI